MIVFLHIPKTGGTTFRSILERNLGASCCHTNQTRRERFTQADLRFARKIFPRLRAITGHNITDPLHLSVPDPFYATFLREPVSRVISHYQDNVLRGGCPLSFERSLHISGELNNLQVKLMAGAENLGRAMEFLARCDFVGLTEKFDHSLQLFGQTTPRPMCLGYRRLIVAKDNRIQRSILADNRLLELAREHNRLDLKLYEFAFKEIFPRLCRKAGINLDTEAPRYESGGNRHFIRYKTGRLYNKLFRQAYKLRHRLIRSPDADAGP